MSAALYNIYIERGATFEKKCTYKDSNGDPVDLTGAVISAQIRQSYSDPEILQTIDVTILDQSVPANLGKFTLYISAEDSALIPVAQASNFETPSTPYCWDMILDTGSRIERLLQGTAYVSPEVTR